MDPPSPRTLWTCLDSAGLEMPVELKYVIFSNADGSENTSNAYVSYLCEPTTNDQNYLGQAQIFFPLGLLVNVTLIFGLSYPTYFVCGSIPSVCGLKSYIVYFS